MIRNQEDQSEAIISMFLRWIYTVRFVSHHSLVPPTISERIGPVGLVYDDETELGDTRPLCPLAVTPDDDMPSRYFYVKPLAEVSERPTHVHFPAVLVLDPELSDLPGADSALDALDRLFNDMEVS